MRASKAVLRIMGIGFLALWLGACSSARIPEPNPALRRNTHPGAKYIEMVIPKSKFQQSLAQGGELNKIRLVEVYDRFSEDNSLQYRFFDVKPGSIYSLMGFQNLDILISANGYALIEAPLFWDYILLLSEAAAGHVEIVRGGRPIVFQYKFVE